MFQDKVVFVTGGAAGIGSAIVESFARSGAVACFCDIDDVAGEALAQRLSAHFYHVDVCDAKSLELAFLDVVERFGGVDILVNNVGVSRFTPLEEISLDEFDSVIATNLRPAFITSRLYARSRNNESGRQRYGRIINISSTRHQQSESSSEAYAASKGAIVSLTHALAVSLSGYNTTVNCISPGWIDTSCGAYEQSDNDRRQHPSGRVGTPSDVARLVMYIADCANDFLNGENITLDGGMTKKMIYAE